MNDDNLFPQENINQDENPDPTPPDTGPEEGLKEGFQFADFTEVPTHSSEEEAPPADHISDPGGAYNHGAPQEGGYMPYGDRPQHTTQAQYYHGSGQIPPPYNQGQVSHGGWPEPASPKKKKTGIKIFFALLASLLIFALLVSSFSLGRMSAPGVSDTSPGKEETTNSGPVLDLQETPTQGQSPSKKGPLTSVEVAEKVKSSVIGITTYKSQSSAGFQSERVEGEGSGIVMGSDEKGNYTYIITCAHVINESGVNIVVQLEDGTQKEADLVGYDVRTDIGVLKVKMKGLTPAEFGDSKALRVGEQVFAVGNPGGAEFYGSFTSGVVSAIDRPVNSSIGYTMELIQHDAAINPGNSGGALVNSHGQVIGINSQKIIASSYEGMGFAIPISAAKNIVDKLIKHSYVPNRPKLGITYYSANSNDTYSMIVGLKGLPAGTIFISEISPDSDLANTDARKGDLVTAVNGKKLDTANVLLELIDEGKVGDVLELTLCRIGRNYNVTEFKVKVKLVEDKGSVPTQEESQGTDSDSDDFFFNPFD